MQDQGTGERLMGKQVDAVLPIASISKLITTLVILDARLDPAETLTILEADVDTLRHSSSHLPVGTPCTSTIPTRSSGPPSHPPQAWP